MIKKKCKHENSCVPVVIEEMVSWYHTYTAMLCTKCMMIIEPAIQREIPNVMRIRQPRIKPRLFSQKLVRRFWE